MSNQDRFTIVPAIRGALLRFAPTATLCSVANDALTEEQLATALVVKPGAGETDLRAGSEGSDIVSAIQTYRERTGDVPRTIRVDRGPTLVVGTSLAVAEERARETLDASKPVSGRSDVVRGRVALVTGGAQGFGEEIVRELVAHGALVFIADLNLEGASALSNELNREFGPVTRPVRADVSDEASVAAMLESVVDLAGGVDLLVSNAGVLKAGSVKELELRDFDFVTRVNYTGFFLCTKHAARVMAAQNAAAPPDRQTDVIQINSKSGLSGSNKNGAYAGGKFGGIGLVQSFALELVADRIKVNAICPGNFFEGPLWSDPERGLFVQYLRAGKVPGAASVADVKAHYERQVPMGRGCRGQDVMRALLYIVEQAYETGQAMPVTGGQIMLS